MTDSCDAGVWATFKNDATGEETTLSVLCELAAHDGTTHWTEGLGFWSEEDLASH